MATVTFYQKPGFRTNARQKQMLEAAGHHVIARSLLSEPWTAEGLYGFFGATPIALWFNPASPRIKSGEIEPATLSADAALALMLDDHLLIRRPLVESDGKQCAGFDQEPVTSFLSRLIDDDSEACSRQDGAPSCPDPHRSSKALAS